MAYTHFQVHRCETSLNQLITEFAPRPTLEYPFEMRWSPEPGKPFEVANGVYWLRMPLPIQLDHINLWILRDGDGWTLVDTGYDSPVCKEVWEQVFEEFLTPDSVKQIIVTHFHPDHIGLAAWLLDKCNCPLLISAGEFNLYHEIHTRDQKNTKRISTEFLQELGFDMQDVAQFMPFFLSEEKPKNSRLQKDRCVFIKDGDDIEIDGSNWRVVSGNGHSPEHSCLYSKDLQVMISGDQAIPRISSNVSVYPANRHEDPLGDWLTSCEKLKSNIPNKTLILPSHQEPFRGLTERMQQLIDDHLAQLNRLRLAVHAPISPIQARSILFDRELNAIETILATGETLAHLNYLVHQGEVVMNIDSNGQARYSAVDQ